MILENLHKRLLDNLKTGVVFLDSELRFTYINAAAQALLEISDRKVHDVFIGDVLVNADKDIDEIQTAMIKNNSFTKRKAELRIVHNKAIFVDYTISPFEHDGKIQALLELNSAEHSQRISREESLHSAHATTRELVRGLAHEIKNPLGGIRGAAQLLAQEVSDIELVDYTKVIIEEADRLHNLVDKLIGSRKPLELKEINIHEVLERVRNLVNAEINGEGIKLIFDYDPSIPFVVGDSEQMIQAMLNIVRNAMQSLNSPNVDHELGQIILRTRISRNVTIGVRFYRLAASIEVIDNGPGIPSDMLETIFFPMISGRANGTGLGLPITHGIINQHNGMIECQSEPGSTNFKVLLPIGKQIQTIIN